MDWRGVWRNQYGSLLTITEDSGNRIAGRFRTALQDSAFFGQEAAVSGVRYGETVSFAFGLEASAGATVCAFTGMLSEGRLHTVWHVVSAAKPWPHAVQTNADVFERAG